MTVFYDDALAGVSAISNLTANLDGKFLVRNGCLEPFHKGKPFDEGVTLKLTDNPWRAENTVVSFKLPGRRPGVQVLFVADQMHALGL